MAYSPPKKTGKMLKPTTRYMLTTEEFDVFASNIESLKTPSGHLSNMAQYIRKRIYGGLKSHDFPRAYAINHAFSLMRSFIAWSKNGSDEDLQGVSKNM